MNSHALGFVEVRGYLTAVVVADAALKAANVSCTGLEVIKGGLTTVLLTGDVGAVKAAVEAGAAIAAEMKLLISSHVIARAHNESLELLAMPGKRQTERCSSGQAMKNQGQAELVEPGTEDVPPQSQQDIKLTNDIQELPEEADATVINVEKNTALANLAVSTETTHAAVCQAAGQEASIANMEAEEQEAAKLGQKSRRRNK